ncbi:hypothetical protein [Nonomuraea sp. NPDC052265]|uniref:hypothetical protein n=1 Tax=Nonomuraea sp. NPDC052265 TaxID=3364374 RepID=UPI0037C57638
MLWTIKFRDLAVADEEITASGYKLTHEGRILSFFDDRGGEVFACALSSASCWAPRVSSTPELRGNLATISSGPGLNPFPQDGRQAIEAQAAAAAAGGMGPRPDGKLVATG